MRKLLIGIRWLVLPSPVMILYKTNAKLSPLRSRKGKDYLINYPKLQVPTCLNATCLMALNLKHIM